MKIRIRHARQNEVKKLADIEAICFPAAEAASEKEIVSRFLAFPENFYVAETIDGKIVGFINGCTTDTPVLKDELYHDTSLHTLTVILGFLIMHSEVLQLVYN